MEAAAAATAAAAAPGRVPACPGATSRLRRDALVTGWARSGVVSVRPRERRVGFADEGHRRYYASPVRCGGKKGEKEAVKRRAKLTMEALEAIRAVGGIGVAVPGGEVERCEMNIKRAADALLAQLELLRAREKEMKRKEKEEKAAMRAAAKPMKACDDDSDESESSEDEQEVMKDSMGAAAASPGGGCGDCGDSGNKETKRKKMEEKKAAMKATCKKTKNCGESEDSSSSSSDESSDSDCEEEVVGMTSLRTTPADAEPVTGQAQVEPPVGELNLPVVVSKIEETSRDAVASKSGPQCSSGVASRVVANGVAPSTSACCGSRGTGPVVVAAESVAPMERIEVCMGGKCKKSGAMELMQEFERRVAIEGAVVGCKCMGKCREGPNVRLRNVCGGAPDETAKAVRNPLCIGVGLDDVGTIVANFFAEKDMGLLAA